MENRKETVKKLIPAVNIMENDKAVLVEAEMVGLSKEEVGIDITGDTLIIKGKKKECSAPEGYELLYGERCSYEYERSFVLGNEVDRAKINAKYDNGILKVTLPKSEELQPKKVEIE